MTKQEAQRRARLETALVGLGFTPGEVETLRRISNTLRRWYELECGTESGHIVRHDLSDLPHWYSALSDRMRIIPDRERGAEGRLAGIMARHAPLTYYLQTDPRGAALCILRPGDIPAGEHAECYPRGICVY